MTCLTVAPITSAIYKCLDSKRHEIVLGKSSSKRPIIDKVLNDSRMQWPIKIDTTNQAAKFCRSQESNQIISHPSSLRSNPSHFLTKRLQNDDEKTWNTCMKEAEMNVNTQLRSYVKINTFDQDDCEEMRNTKYKIAKNTKKR